MNNSAVPSRPQQNPLWSRPVRWTGPEGCDTMQETLSLSDRFGLSVNFSKPDKQAYIDIVLGLADELHIDYDREKLVSEAETWAISRGGRSPRCARQFISSVLVRLNN